MDDHNDQKGVRFLQLIDRQSTLQQAMISKLAVLISVHRWDSDEIKSEIEDMVQEHKQVTREINGLDQAA